MTSSAVELRYMTVSPRGSVGTRDCDHVEIRKPFISVYYHNHIPSSEVVNGLELENGPLPTAVSA